MAEEQKPVETKEEVKEEPKPVEPETPAVDLSGLNTPIKKLTKEQKQQLIDKYKDKNDHAFYDIHVNSKGEYNVYKRRKTAQEEILQENPNTKMTENQMLQAQIVNLERKYIRLLDKHKKLKKRVNKIDEDTIIYYDEDELPKEKETVQPEPVKEEIQQVQEQPPQPSYQRHPGRSLRSLFVQ